MNKPAIVVLFAFALGIAACGKKKEDAEAPGAPPPVSVPAAPASPAATPAVTVSNITIGNAIGADKKVTAGASTLARNDTIYASVDTAGAGSATIRAKWSYLQGGEPTVVNEETLTIEPSGSATSEFHISKPDGWPAGEYQVEIFVDDVSAGTRRFTVN